MIKTTTQAPGSVSSPPPPPPVTQQFAQPTMARRPEGQMPGAVPSGVPLDIPAPSAAACSIRIIGRDNGVGLSRDREILAEALRAAGLAVEVVGLDDTGRGTIDTCIHIEVPDTRQFPSARRNVVIPNPECFAREWLPCLGAKGVEVWAKTAQAAEIFEKLGTAPVRRVGFTSRDRNKPDIARTPRWLHLAGKSVHKGTKNVIETWAAHPEWPMITIVAAPELKLPDVEVANVDLMREWLSDDEILELQNSCRFHLCPSDAEGFGHYIFEGLSCGAIVVTSDAAPMNEAVTEKEGFRGPGIFPNSEAPGSQCGFLAATTPSNGPAWETLGRFCSVSRKALEEVVARVLKLPENEMARIGKNARERWEANNHAFRAEIVKAIGGA